MLLNISFMDWQGRRESGNVEDRRGLTGGHFAVGGGVLGVIYLLFRLFFGGGDATDTQQLQPAHQMTQQEQAADDQRAHFVKVVLADTEDVWDRIFSEQGKTYTHPTLVLFRNATESGCGFASAASGPFYCPLDHDVYIDLSFAEELQNRFHAGGDFALAYVVAHEVGHHVQYLLGITEKMDKLRQQMSETEYNKYSVKLELQADFYAGLWAHYDQKMKDVIHPEDINEALSAASAVGDDNLQKQSQGRVVPDAFTHGSSEQRMYWFKRGYDTGDLSKGNTFDQ
jgi:uncharacterized protein